MHILIYGDDGARMEEIGEALRAEQHFVSYRTAAGWCGEVEACDRVIFVNATAALERAYQQTEADLVFDKGQGVPRPKDEKPEAPEQRQAAEEIDIPEDWQQLPFFSKKAIAKQLGSAAKNGDEVDKAIQAELAKRAARG